MASHNEQNPMSLEDLPKYLKSLKEKGQIGTGNLVEMGRISKPGWTQRIILAASICMIVGATGALGYNLSLNKSNNIVVVDFKDKTNLDAISKMVADSGDQIIAVKQNEDLTYEVKVSTKKSRKTFLEWIRKNKLKIEE